MKNLSIQKTTDAYPNLSAFDRERLSAFENQQYCKTGNVFSVKELGIIANEINKIK